jgi:putative membrane protein
MMMGFGLIGTVLVIVLIAMLIGWRPQGGQTMFGNNAAEKSPREILMERYARGEITKEEFEQMRQDLG